MGSFDGKTVLITGGGTGIGAAAARRFANLGGNVVVTGRRAAPLEAVATATGGLAVVGDTADEAHCADAVGAAVDKFGGLDVLVANAAIEVFGSITEISLEDWRAALRINLDGVMMISRAAIPAMRKRGGGSIIIVSSALGLAAAPHFASYITSKTALVGLTRAMALDYGPENIRVNVLCPGWVRTELGERAIQTAADAKGVSLEAMIERVTSHYPLKRIAEPDEIATCIEFLASPASSFVTGSILSADGGGLGVNVGLLEF